MSHKQIVEALIDTQGTLYSEEIGADIARDTPQELFHWLIGATLLSSRISADNAVKAGAALRDAGLHKIDALLDARREDVVRVLNENGYARFDESTTDYLRETAEMVRDEYDGDLRKMRKEDPARALLKAKGIGPKGAEIFAREAQLVWDEFYPTLGDRALTMAKDLGLPEDASELSKAAGNHERFVRLVAALTRAALDGPSEDVTKAAD
ncbi:hypothetical protein [Pelagovum pacificum]|uniref:Endonuclease n=1 Tax=Pelagovum pacificum TaxID=2588711 RepID=A0A5C5GBC2_9RHOB|nr:hypothetical protein [Pelagovum pacificum]QQA41344.1 hypothetical protein I8N54_10930 [Pelagovum pacificum]TNY31850.1 hypothetical protein FHY64_00665 [Pelagovum pacificum]